MSEIDEKNHDITEEPNEPTDIKKSPVLDPYEIWSQIHHRFQMLEKSNPEECKKALEILVKEFPIIAYIYHMEQSGHSATFIDLIKELVEQKGLKIEMPFADIGCGPGNMMWWFLNQGLIPPGDIAMVDVDKNYIDYAQELLVEREKRIPLGDTARNNFHFFNINAEEFAQKSDEKGLKFNTVYSSLVLQWIAENLPPEEAKEALKSVCQSIFDSMNPGGKFIFIGEIPTNVTATTPVSFAQGGFKEDAFDIGYNKGCSWEDVHKACIDTGFQLEDKPITHIIGPIKSRKELIAEKRRFMQQVVRVMKGEDEVDSELLRESTETWLRIQNFHHAAAAVYKKP